jgi:hypothetical protein
MRMLVADTVQLADLGTTTSTSSGGWVSSLLTLLQTGLKTYENIQVSKIKSRLQENLAAFRAAQEANQLDAKAQEVALQQISADKLRLAAALPPELAAQFLTPQEMVLFAAQQSAAGKGELDPFLMAAIIGGGALLVGVIILLLVTR